MHLWQPLLVLAGSVALFSVSLAQLHLLYFLWSWFLSDNFSFWRWRWPHQTSMKQWQHCWVSNAGWHRAARLAETLHCHHPALRFVTSSSRDKLRDVFNAKCSCETPVEHACYRGRLDLNCDNVKITAAIKCKALSSHIYIKLTATTWRLDEECCELLDQPAGSCFTNRLQSHVVGRVWPVS